MYDRLLYTAEGSRGLCRKISLHSDDTIFQKSDIATTDCQIVG